MELIASSSVRFYKQVVLVQSISIEESLGIYTKLLSTGKNAQCERCN